MNYLQHMVFETGIYRGNGWIKMPYHREKYDDCKLEESVGNKTN